jgi:hypothetical protein
MADRKSIVQVKIRLRKDILKSLERAAKTKDRSVNAEMVDRLTQSIVNSNIADNFQQWAKIATEKAVDVTADRIIKRLRTEIAQDQQNEKSLLGHAGRRTIVGALSEPKEEKQDEPKISAEEGK